MWGEISPSLVLIIPTEVGIVNPLGLYFDRKRVMCSQVGGVGIFAPRSVLD